MLQLSGVYHPFGILRVVGVGETNGFHLDKHHRAVPYRNPGREWSLGLRVFRGKIAGFVSGRLPSQHFSEILGPKRNAGILGAEIFRVKIPPLSRSFSDKKFPRFLPQKSTKLCVNDADCT